jgi:hypothetical protein
LITPSILAGLLPGYPVYHGICILEERGRKSEVRRIGLIRQICPILETEGVKNTPIGPLESLYEGEKESGITGNECQHHHKGHKKHETGNKAQAPGGYQPGTGSCVSKGRLTCGV